MAIEAKRGCGYRKVGGIYLVGGEGMHPCDRLPIELTVCPCCGGGIKQTRGWTWIDPVKLLGDDHPICKGGCGCNRGCPVCFPSLHFPDGKKAGLLWIGEQFYPTPADFLAEGVAQRISRRISAIPRDFKIGETYVFFAHPKVIAKPKVTAQNGLFSDSQDAVEVEWAPAIFSGFMPSRIERIVLDSEFALWTAVRTALDEGQELEKVTIDGRCLNQGDVEICLRMKRDQDRGITLVPVPDDDPDHNPAA